MSDLLSFAIDASGFTEPPAAPGVYFDLSSDLYHRGPGLSSTGVRRLMKTPFHYIAATLPHDDPKPAPSASMVNGTLVHCALLEPDEYPKRYRVGPAVNKNTNLWREYVAEWAAQGVQVIGAEQHQAATAQAQSLLTIPDVADLVRDGVREVSAYWIDQQTGVLCKCRPDCVTLVDDGAALTLTDVKTTTDASETGFAKSIANFGYHVQAAWYIDGFALASGIDVSEMVFAVVENEYPYASAAYLLDEAAIDYARIRNRAALSQFAACMTSQQWPGYPREIQPITLPGWAMRA